MQTRSMTRTCNEKKRQKISHPGYEEDQNSGFTIAEAHDFHHNRPAYDKEQNRRRLSGIKPIIICMGGPYSDAWYPPHN